MDSWPTDNRTERVQLVKQRGKKGETRKKVIALQYPHIKQGAFAGVTLRENYGRLEWSTIVEQSHEKRLASIGKPTVLFPDTRPAPLVIPRTTVLQRAEQGAHFLRTYYPDVDIAAELVRDEIVEDEYAAKQLETFDPTVGNTLELVYKPRPSKTAFLAFPMGQLGRDLNMSPFTYGRKDQIVFRPLAHATRTFPTPIQQIVSSSSSDSPQNNVFLLVRTLGSMSILDVAMNTKSCQLTDVAIVTSSDVGNKSLVDAAFYPSSLKTAIVNNYGSVYTCDISEGRKTAQLVHALSEPSHDLFWRISFGGSQDCLLASNKKITRMDFRTNDSQGIIELQQQGDMITDIEGPLQDHLIRSSSTSSIFWIDERYPRKPLLSYEHNRQFDRSLRLQTLSLAGTHLTCLTSPKNGVVTVYDVSRSRDNLLHVHHTPYPLPPILSYNTAHSGQRFFQHPLEQNRTRASLLQLTRRGGIRSLDFAFTDTDDALFETPYLESDWSTGVKSLASKSLELHPDIGLLGSRDMSEVDVSPCYNGLFRSYTEEGKATAEEDAETVYDILERIPSYMQETEAPVEHMLTTFDIAFRSGDEPLDSSRADFLTQSAINSVRGYRALIQGRLSVKPLISHVSWHYNIRSILRQLGTHIPEDHLENAEQMHKFDLAPHPDRPLQSMRQESEAREQLVLDLALSTDIYLSRPFSKPSGTNADVVSHTAQSMRLADEPRPIHFGYLRPISKEDSEDNSQDDLVPLGVRLLLGDWDVGTRPEDFVYTDPYAGDTQGVSHAMKPNHIPVAQPAQPTQPTQQMFSSQRPPAILTSKSTLLPHVQSSAIIPRLMPSNSQPLQHHHAIFGSQPSAVLPPSMSQELETSTQILPGAFGGRQSFAKKRPGKKRVGGF